MVNFRFFHVLLSSWPGSSFPLHMTCLPPSPECYLKYELPFCKRQMHSLCSRPHSCAFLRITMFIFPLWSEHLCTAMLLFLDCFTFHWCLNLKMFPWSRIWCDSVHIYSNVSKWPIIVFQMWIINSLCNNLWFCMFHWQNASLMWFFNPYCSEQHCFWCLKFSLSFFNMLCVLPLKYTRFKELLNLLKPPSTTIHHELTLISAEHCFS